MYTVQAYVVQIMVHTVVQYSTDRGQWKSPGRGCWLMVAASLTESCVMCCVAWCRYYFNLQQTHKTQELPGLVVLDIGSVATTLQCMVRYSGGYITFSSVKHNSETVWYTGVVLLLWPEHQWHCDTRVTRCQVSGHQWTWDLILTTGSLLWWLGDTNIMATSTSPGMLCCKMRSGVESPSWHRVE